jgi:predicted transcriptional regulator
MSAAERKEPSDCFGPTGGLDLACDCSQSKRRRDMSKRKEVERRIVAFVEEKGEAIVDEVAAAVGVTASTARKYLAGLADAGELKRTEGGRERGRKRPDRFSVASGKRGEKEPNGTPSTPVPKARLGPGQLDGLVLAYMREHREDAPHTPSRIGKGIGRSSGAVANCLRRLGDSDRAVLAKKKPRAYNLPKGE